MTVQHADFKLPNGKWAETFTKDGVNYMTKARAIYLAILARCNPLSWVTLFPTYKGCYVEGVFKDFQTFTDWYVTQVGYGIKGYEIDKDLLITGNKVYSEDSCVLIPKFVNLFLTHKKNKKQAGPTGVQKSGNKYYAAIGINGKLVSLGGFRTEIEAMQAYKEAKEQRAKDIVLELMDNDIDVDKRVIEALLSWEYVHKPCSERSTFNADVVLCPAIA